MTMAPDANATGHVPWQGGTVASEVALIVTGSPVNVTGTVARSHVAVAVSEDLAKLEA